MTSAPITIHYNDRNYSPHEWEAWKASEVIAHAQDLRLLTDKYPAATVAFKQAYTTFIRLAECSAEAPMLAVPDGHSDDRGIASRWLAMRLTSRGYKVRVSEALAALNAFLDAR